MKATVRRIIPDDHPSLAGHFPGHPVVPGIVLLEEVVQAVLERLDGPWRLRAIAAVKFTAPLQPAQAFTIDISTVAESRVKFQCFCRERLLAQGQLDFEPAASTEIGTSSPL